MVVEYLKDYSFRDKSHLHFFHAQVLFCKIMSDNNMEKIESVKTDVKCHEYWNTMKT